MHYTKEIPFAHKLILGILAIWTFMILGGIAIQDVKADRQSRTYTVWELSQD